MQEDRVGPENRVALGNLIFPFACEKCSSTLMGSSPFQGFGNERKRGIYGMNRRAIDSIASIDQNDFEFGMEIVNYRSSGYRPSERL